MTVDSNSKLASSDRLVCVRRLKVRVLAGLWVGIHLICARSALRRPGSHGSWSVGEVGAAGSHGGAEATVDVHKSVTSMSSSLCRSSRATQPSLPYMSIHIESLSDQYDPISNPEARAAQEAAAVHTQVLRSACGSVLPTAASQRTAYPLLRATYR